jgi:GrpB-like predicted nucleotidyltransferase (UPF0157 family)
MANGADEPILILPYSASWPTAFEAERAALESAIGAWASGGIHHVGSTAVPGLAAKPIVDILVGVDDLPSSRACFSLLEPLGYVHFPYLAEEMHWFCKPGPARRSHHLHLAPTNSARFADEICFRDLLRSDSELASRYARLKRELAARHRLDRDAYTEAKGEFVRAALRERTREAG